MTAMENKACGKEAGVDQEWMISSPTSLAVDSLDSWVARGVAPGMGVGGEERTWSIHSSKTKLVHSHACLLELNVCTFFFLQTFVFGIVRMSLMFATSQPCTPTLLSCHLKVSKHHPFLQGVTGGPLQWENN